MQIALRMYVSTIVLWDRMVDNAVATAATAFQRLNAQSSNLYRSEFIMTEVCTKFVLRRRTPARCIISISFWATFWM